MNIFRVYLLDHLPVLKNNQEGNESKLEVFKLCGVQCMYMLHLICCFSEMLL